VPPTSTPQGTHGYYFLDDDGEWRFLLPYREDFRDSISTEIPQPHRRFDWRYKVWVISPSYFDDAMDIAKRHFEMTQLFSSGLGMTSKARAKKRLEEIEEQLRRALVRMRAAESKVTQLQSEIVSLGKTDKGKIGDHTGVDCLAAVRKNYPLEALFHLLPSAPNEVLRGAYRALSLLTHPDRHPARKQEAEEEQKRLNVAYDTLSKRRGM
jgi:hypothetical protein